MKKGPILLANSSEQNLCEKICSYRGAKLDENRTSTPTNSTIMQSIGAVCRLVVISPAVSLRLRGVERIRETRRAIGDGKRCYAGAMSRELLWYEGGMGVLRYPAMDEKRCTGSVLSTVF